MRQEEIFREKNIAQVHDYWNARPCNIRHSPQPVGSREYFDEVEARKNLVGRISPGLPSFRAWPGSAFWKSIAGLAPIRLTLRVRVPG
jgi:hypothetical protein